jgi:hypothetical protein
MRDYLFDFCLVAFGVLVGLGMPDVLPMVVP